MAMEDLHSRRRRPGRSARELVRALFPEARRRERRRRLGYASLLLLVAFCAVVVVKASEPPQKPAVAVRVPRHAVASSVALAPSDHFSTLSVIGDRLLLSGGRQFAVSPGYEASLTNGRIAGTCNAAIVDPRTLVIGPVRTANCGDPSLYGEHVMPVAYVRRGSAAGSNGPMLAISIAVATPGARDGYTLGPVLTTYPYCSGCQATWIRGDGFLWVYNPTANQHKRGGELFRISVKTGKVLRRWSMPSILRPLLAADSDGLWLSPSIESGVPGPLPPPADLIQYESLYRIAPNATKPKRVLIEGGDGARWLTAAGHTASAAVSVPKSLGFSTVWTFTANKRPTHGPELSDSPMGAEFGVGSPTVAGSPTEGYFNVVLDNGKESVIQVKPNSRHEATVAAVRSRYASQEEPNPAVITLDGSLFYLDTSGNTAKDLRRVTTH